MNLNEAASLLGVSRERALMAIDPGIETSHTRKRVRLAAVSLSHGYDISQQALDEFIGAFENEEPGRHPPVAVRRSLLIESGYKCAVCRENAPLEFHHIIEWATIKHHDPEYMLAICANCHGKITRYGDPDVASQKTIKRELRERRQAGPPSPAVDDKSQLMHPRSPSLPGGTIDESPDSDHPGRQSKLDGNRERLRHILSRIPAIRSSLTRRRWQRLAQCATPEMVAACCQVVEPLSRHDGALEPMLVAIWRVAQDNGLVPYIEALDGRMDLAGLLNLYLEKKPLWCCQPQGEPHSIGPHLHAQKAAFAWVDGSWQRNHAFAGPLFEILWEAIRTYTNDEISFNNSVLRWWNAAGGSLPGKPSIIFPWPSIDLPGFSEYDKLERLWNQELSRALAFSEHLPKDTTTADNLAFWYVDYLHARALSHRESWTRNWKWLIPHLAEALNNIQTAGATTTKDVASAEWIRSIPLLAAPESGLSRETAATILECTKLTDQRRSALHHLRIARIRACLPNQNAELIMRELDAAQPEHPWIAEIRAS